ncbi:5-formyltetrahydrofolate cyclo-ligase [Paractinoplanes maris]|uniref:5-formyltetrahydrofolate cyclo-ligase n=1 Tax=Paractinoplanes maris TaxID=1734446 RepID=UPI0034DAFC0E
MWSLLDAHGVSYPLGATGRIPRFSAADVAAQRLAETAAWEAAETLKVNPDTAQFPVRLHALAEGKVVYMAVPYLAGPHPFYFLDPAELGEQAPEAATIDGAARLAPSVGFDEMREIDLAVCGSVAVNRNGARVGKGGGYADIELALLVEAGLITARTVLATTVHELQVVHEELPETAHDFRLDVIASPVEVVRCGSPYRPSGIYPSHLTSSKIASIPILRDRMG